MLDTQNFSWEKLEVQGTTPGPRRAHTSWSYNGNVYIYAGGDGVKALDDLYMLKLDEGDSLICWIKIKTMGKSPRPRGYHTSNLVDDKLVVLGGSDGHECFSDIHVLDLKTFTWTQSIPNRQIPRLSHSSTIVGSYLFVLCGHDGNNYSNQVLLLNLKNFTWETKKILGNFPKQRGYHSAILFDSRIFLFGGYDGSQVFDDFWALNLTSSAYLPLVKFNI
ncbi:hypothetical protein HDU92_008621 [Lobulomyces angularis]|nr:hypothetical protein HDU92_008621 [Lobulomyces angularis]